MHSEVEIVDPIRKPLYMTPYEEENLGKKGKKVQTAIIGAAGEYLVLSRLLQRGILSSLSPFNAYKADILVNPMDGGRASYIQVKTTTKVGKSEWSVSAKDMKNFDKNMFYCFVEINSDPQKIYVVPATKVSQVLIESDRAYMATPMRDGSKRKEHKYRLIKNHFQVKVRAAPDGWMDKYLEKWDQFM